MRHRLLQLTWAFAALLLPSVAKAEWSDDGNTYYMMTKDGYDKAVQARGNFTLETKSGGSYNYRDCGVSFTPSAPGEVLVITVEEISMPGECYLLVYDGTEPEMGKNGLSDGNGQSRFFAPGWKLKLTSADVGKTYTTAADDGSISIGLHSGSNPQFKINIQSVVPNDMEFISATALADIDKPRRGGKGQVIASFDVLTSGIKNPLNVEAMCVNVTASDAVSNFRLQHKGATLATLEGGGLTISDAVKLSSGHNIFNVVADIAPDASGSIPAPVMVSLNVGGTDRGTVPAPAPTVDNVIWMPAGTTTFTIGDNVGFYDDGGPSGTIGENFSGQVTFIPSTPGSAIKIDFSKLELFCTNPSSNDIFKFYNGRNADESQLITTLLTEPRIVKSTAADGSMTVTLQSTTGIPKAGWEAVVSQFVPGPMTLSGVTSTLPTAATSTVSAGDKGIRAIIVDVNTDNTGSPLKISRFALSSASPATLKEVHVYSLGDKATATPGVSLADATGSASVTLPVDATLLEGHNYFLITADVADSAVNDDTLDLTLTGVTVGGSDQAASGDTHVALKVKNVCHSTEGNHSHNLNSPWEFLPTITGTKYDSGTTDQIVTFKPVSAGHVAQIAFESFHVYYASTSYGTKATFKVYSGTTCTESNLLWELSSNADQDKGPGSILRSTSADGALTIRFNPNSSSSYYCAEGWKATVSEFKNHDMSITGTEVRQSSQGELATATKNVPMIDYTITTEGTLSTKNIKSVKLKLDGAAALDKVTVYASQTADRNSAVRFGEAQAAAEVTVNGEFTMKEGDNYMWVEADIKADAEPETTIDATLLSLTDSKGNTDNVANGNPEGTHTVKFMILEEAGNHVIDVTRTIMFYDDGGKDGKVGSIMGTSKTAVYTFVPVGDNKAVKIDAKQFSMGNGRVYFYSGRETDDSKILGNPTGYSAMNGPADPLISKAEDGTITVSIKNPTSQLDGFAFEISLHEKQPFTLGSIETSRGVITDRMVRGAVDVPLTRVAVTVDGDKGESDVESLAFAVSDATIARTRLYYGGPCDNFNIYSAKLLSTAVPANGTVTLTAGNSTGGNGTYYYYLVTDLNPDASAGTKATASLSGIRFNGTDHTPGETAAQEIEVRAGLAGGTYTVGQGGTYTTLAEASAALADGIEGPVTMEILDGTYKEYLKISDVQGTSEANRLIFKSQSGNRDNVVIKPSWNSNEGDFLTSVNHTPWVTLTGLTIDATGQSSFKVAVLTNDRSHDFTLENCVMTGDRPSSYSGIELFQSYNSTLESQLGTTYDSPSRNGFSSHNITVTGCVFNGGKDGVYLSGCGIVGNARATGATVNGNTFNNVKGMGIYVNNFDDIAITDNLVSTPTVDSTQHKGMDINGSSNFTLTGNKIAITPTSDSNYCTGLYIRSNSGGTDGKRSLIANNDIVITKNKQYGYAVQFENTSHDIDFVYNTVRMGGSGGYLWGATSNYTPQNVVVANNLLQSEITATNNATDVIYLSYGSCAAGYTFDHNALYAANGRLLKLDNEHVTDIEQFNAKIGDTEGTNFVEQAVFADETNQHLRQPGTKLNSARVIETVKTDRDGRERPATGATVGAYEYVPLSTEAPSLADGYPMIVNITENSADVRTKWTVAGRLYAKTVRAADNAPTAEEMLATSSANTDDGVEIVTKVTGLEPETAYRTYLYSVSVLGNASPVLATGEFTTLRHIEPLEIATSGEIVIEAGEEASIGVIAEGGDEPYTYKWVNQMNETVGTASDTKVTPSHSQAYTVTVSSADGQEASGKVDVIVRGDFVPATFEDSHIAAGGIIAPPDNDGRLFSGSLAFNGATMYYGSISYWNGYTFSASTSGEYNGLADQYNSAPGGGIGDGNFAVGFPEAYTINVTNNAEGAVIPGMYFTNSAMAFESMSHGDGFAKKFVQGDWFKCTVTGTHADGTTASTDFYLADMRPDNEADRYILDSWEWVDLRSLGAVTSLGFKFDSTDKTGAYLNTPQYICLDNIGMMPSSGNESVTVGFNESIDLAALFGYSGEATAAYTLLDTDTDMLSLNDGVLSIDSGGDKGELKLTALVGMTAAGHGEYLNLDITRTPYVSLDQMAVSSRVRLYPIPVTERLNIATGMQDYTFELYAPDGSLASRAGNLCGNASIERGALQAGVYISRLLDKEGAVVHVQRIIVR